MARHDPYDLLNKIAASVPLKCEILIIRFRSASPQQILRGISVSRGGAAEERFFAVDPQAKRQIEVKHKAHNHSPR